MGVMRRMSILHAADARYDLAGAAGKVYALAILKQGNVMVTAHNVNPFDAVEMKYG